MQKRNIVWLASYPKSGNTWLRAFLTALLGESEDIDINGLKTNGIFSSREIFEALTDIDSTYLYDEEIKALLPDVFSQLSNEVEKVQYIKVHDAYTINSCGKSIIPAGPTKCAIYIIRNPLDVVASFANHNASTIQHSIKLMNDPFGSLAKQKNNLNTNHQFKQLMLSWSGHVISWTSQKDFPLHIIRYEDMLNDPLSAFSKAVNFMEIEAEPEKIQQAIEVTAFDRLQEKEKQSGFREKNHASAHFFRSGRSGNWPRELTREQARSIVECHHETMMRHDYDIDFDKYYS